MSSAHNDLHSWASKARAKGFDTIEISVETAFEVVDDIVQLATQLAEIEQDVRKLQEAVEYNPTAHTVTVHCRWLLDLIDNHDLQAELTDEDVDLIEHIRETVALPTPPSPPREEEQLGSGSEERE
ncbi:hypothetical protein ACLE20_13165 [Rhizobium sp. YIM 134829]|uniref:hypothetical protein n=1 Tax=Rhizobium sp. YIM 134829 TaxID=3390453 RepID=UPI00397855A3